MYQSSGRRSVTLRQQNSFRRGGRHRCNWSRPRWSNWVQIPSQQNSSVAVSQASPQPEQLASVLSGVQIPLQQTSPKPHSLSQRRSGPRRCRNHALAAAAGLVDGAGRDAGVVGTGQALPGRARPAVDVLAAVVGDVPQTRSGQVVASGSGVQQVPAGKQISLAVVQQAPSHEMPLPQQTLSSVHVNPLQQSEVSSQSPFSLLQVATQTRRCRHRSSSRCCRYRSSPSRAGTRRRSTPRPSRKRRRTRHNWRRCRAAGSRRRGSNLVARATSSQGCSDQGYRVRCR